MSWTGEERRRRDRSDEKDVADLRLTFNVKHIYTIIATVVGITLVAASGWMALKSDVAEAKNGFNSLSKRVERIECLLQQSNNYQMYGIKPTKECVVE